MTSIKYENTSNRRNGILFLIVISLTFSIFNFKSLNLNVGLPVTLFFVDYEDKTRNKSWNQIAQEELDPFIEGIAKDQKNYRISWGLNSFTHLPAHIFHKVFQLRGEKLWLASKLLLVVMGIALSVLVFLIGDLYFGPQVGLMAGILTFFSPHLWAIFNISSDPSQPYNVFFGLLTIYAFLKYLVHSRRSWLYACGIAMGINFLFFHVGSFLFPVVIFLICVYKSILAKKFWQIGNYFIIVIIAFTIAACLNEVQADYFNLSYNPFVQYIQEYVEFGPAGSHTVHGLMFLDGKKFFSNIVYHLNGVFFSGVTQDWHHGSSLTTVPMVYNYIVGFLFVLTCAYHVRVQREKEFIIFLWFFAFFFIYTCMVFVRQKNISGELPPIFILAARGLAPLTLLAFRNLNQFLKRKLTRKLLISTPLKNLPNRGIHKFISYKKTVYGLGIFLIISSITISVEKTMFYLPSKGYFGAYRSHHEVYSILSEKGYSPKTQVLFSGMDVGFNMMLHLFLDKGAPKMDTWNSFGVKAIDNEIELNKWKAMELELLNESDKIFFCFTTFDDYMGARAEDSIFQKLFKKNHPEQRPIHSISNPAGDIIWSIYEVSGEIKS